MIGRDVQGRSVVRSGGLVAKRVHKGNDQIVLTSRKCAPGNIAHNRRLRLRSLIVLLIWSRIDIQDVWRINVVSVDLWTAWSRRGVCIIEDRRDWHLRHRA